jgi:hypothetical protein
MRNGTKRDIVDQNFTRKGANIEVHLKPIKITIYLMYVSHCQKVIITSNDDDTCQQDHNAWQEQQIHQLTDVDGCHQANEYIT